MKKKAFYMALLLVLVACEDKFEVTYRYSKFVSQSKAYPVYLDMSEIGNIQVKTAETPVAPFKIVSNDKYYFVGDMMKGIHVYEKKGEHNVDYSCFIACKYLKAFDVVNDYLFCNNFVDMVVLDVGNPLQTTVLHRKRNHFNKFESFVASWNIPYDDNKGCVVDYHTESLYGTVTEKQPELDFSEFDQLYENLTTNDIPASWISNNPEIDKPYTGIIKVGDDHIVTYGNYNSWAICYYSSGSFHVEEISNLNTSQGNYAPPIYDIDRHPTRLLYKDGIIYIFSALMYSGGMSQCFMYDASYYFFNYNNMPVDVTYIKSLNYFYSLTDNFIRRTKPKYYEFNFGFEISPGAVAITEAQDNLITLGNRLTVYLPSETDLQFIRDYPEISGSCMLKDGNVLAIANQQGLFFYDISNLENIVPIL